MGFPSGTVIENLPAIEETQEMWVQSLGWEDSLEEEITTKSSILAWRITWREEPGSQRIGHTHTHLVKISPTARCRKMVSF